MTKSLSLRAQAAARILATISSMGITSLPDMWPQRLGHTWSSRFTPAQPASSNSWTVRTTLTTFPYPVSPSAITGISTALTMLRVWFKTSVKVSRPQSG